MKEITVKNNTYSVEEIKSEIKANLKNNDEKYIKVNVINEMNNIQHIVELCFRKTGSNYRNISPNRIEDLYKDQFKRVIDSFNEAKETINDKSFIENLYINDEKIYISDNSYFKELSNCCKVYSGSFQLYARLENLRRKFSL